MKTVIFAYSRRGLETAGEIARLLEKKETIRVFAPSSYCCPGKSGTAEPIPKPSAAFYGEQFTWADTMIFVGALGIAVRNIAPHVRSKTTDPGVLCVDEKGQFVISVLSGHIGGANRAAGHLAELLHAVPVITTATDINHRFSVDAWASEQGLFIGSMKTAKMISAAILERDIPLCSDLPLRGDYPPGVFEGDSGDLGICISWIRKSPFVQTLSLVPTVIHLGVGCRKGTPEEAIREAILCFLEKEQWDIRAVAGLYTIDLKAKEPGLLAFCRTFALPLTVYTAEELRKVEGTFTASAFVQHVTGVDNVCERAALREADRLLVPKTVQNGVTVAAAIREQIICFD